jgi:hypothetical protein
MADFQNRLFQAYVAKRRALYLPLSEAFPRDIDLFSDPVHIGEPGLRLQAWILLQQLVPWLEARLADGRLPRRMLVSRPEHPAFTGNPRQLVSLHDVRAGCRTAADEVRR